MSGMTTVQKGQPLNQEEAKSNDIPDSQVSVTVAGAITINVFFDGIGNNMFNTQARLKQEHTKLADETSYKNYYSNIALLYMASGIKETVRNIYIEGSGTFKYKGDSTIGLATSQGESGVYNRVTEAFKKADEIRIALNAKKIIFNVFGFSRGAFYACYFFAMAKMSDEEMKSEEEKLKAYIASFSIREEGKEENVDPRTLTYRYAESGRNRLKLSCNKISINFVGIYDTVSSHGADHYNDVQPFELNIGGKQGIRKIVHLTAQNEYRNHFPLTHINTAVADGIGFECSLPGAHSDIGGTYCDDWHETQYFSTYNGAAMSPLKKSGEIHWQWFVDKGYYQGKPVLKQSSKPPRGATYTEQLILTFRAVRKDLTLTEVFANRQFTSNNYQFIPLQIMKEITEKETAIQFDNPKGYPILTKDIASIDNYATLVKFRDYAKHYILSRYTKVGMSFAVKAADTLSTDEEKQLYHQFIHNSLDPDSIANDSDERNKGANRIEIHDDC